MSGAKAIMKKRNRAKSKLSEDALRKLLCEAARDDKAEAQRNLLMSLRPVLLELIENKGWSSRITARFLTCNGIKLKALEIDAHLKAIPFDSSDISALKNLMAMQSPKKDVEALAK